MVEHPVYKGYYADKIGNVYGRRGKRLKPVLHHTGYHVISIHNGHGELKQARLHRFIYECFNGICEDNSKVINHKDGVKTNNSLDNLELVTQSENAKHAFDNDLRFARRGTDSNLCSTEESLILTAIDMINKGFGNTEIQRLTGVDHRRVSDIRHGKKWKHLHHLIN